MKPSTFGQMKADAQDSKNLFDVRKKVAFVTGSSSGLGRHAANVLARCGASVVGIARRQEKLQDWVEENEGKVACEAHDLGDETQLERLAEKVLEHFGPPDILVHAAGLNNRMHADTIDRTQWNETLWLNLSVPFFFSQHFVSFMKAKKLGKDCELRVSPDFSCLPQWNFLWCFERGHRAVDPVHG